VILTESGLSFIGLGVTPPDPSWGQMVGTLKEYLRLNPFPILWPCLAISLTILSVNLMGDSFRDAVDPTYSRRRRRWTLK